MNYGQTAIGEVRVIANYLGINPWEFESPFVLAIYIQYRECRYVCIMEIRHSLQYWIAVVRISLFSNKFIIEMYRTST